MCDTTDLAKRTQRTYQTNRVILFFVIVLLGVMALLIQRFNSLLHDANEMQEQNHIITCHIDQRLSNGETLYQCRDVNVTP